MMEASPFNKNKISVLNLTVIIPNYSYFFVMWVKSPANYVTELLTYASLVFFEPQAMLEAAQQTVKTCHLSKLIHVEYVDK